MIKLHSPVIVEGKYDKITLENVIDALIIPTNGFGLFKDKEKCRLIKTLGEKFGIIVITDSDYAGNMIRAYIKNIASGCEITNVYIPQIKGKEKRKTKGSKEGFLGLEGMTPEIIEDALKKSGIIGKKIPEKGKKITKTDLFLRGLSGQDGSLKKRQELLKILGLPKNLTPNAMLDILNTVMTYKEFCEVTDRWLKNPTRN